MLNPQPEGKPRSCSSSMQLVAHALYVASFAGYISRTPPQLALALRCRGNSCELTPQKNIGLGPKKNMGFPFNSTD